MYKTESVVSTKNRIQTILLLYVGEVIETKPAAKYLELLVDSKLCFWELRTESLMANVHGSKFRLLMTATQLVLPYAAEIWPEDPKVSYRKRLAQVQRRGAQKEVCLPHGL